MNDQPQGHSLLNLLPALRLALDSPLGPLTPWSIAQSPMRNAIMLHLGPHYLCHLLGQC